MEDQKKAGSFNGYSSSQIDFVEEFKIDYLLTTYELKKEKLLLEKFYIEEVDKVNGIYFYLRRPEGN